MHNTQSRLPVNDNDVVTSIATIGTFEAVVIFFFNFLLYLQLNQTCHLQSTSLHSWYTAPKVFSSSVTRPGTCFAGWREGPVSNFLLSPLLSEIGDLLVRISTSGTRKGPQESNPESRAAGGQESTHASSKIHG